MLYAHFYKIVTATALTGYNEDDNLPYFKEQLAKNALGKYIHQFRDEDVSKLIDNVSEPYYEDPN